MRLFKILSLMTVISLLAGGCYNTDNAITYSKSDVSSRISGFSSDVTGAGATLTIKGTDLDKAQRIAFGNIVVPSQQFTDISATGITFKVPVSAPLGDTPVLVVFPGNARATSNITVVPLPLVTSVNPPFGDAGDAVTIYGTNFDNVDGINFGTTAGSITSKTPTKIVATAPTGVVTSAVTVTSPAGNSTSTQQFVVCSGAPTDPLCIAPLNLNSGFENGSGDNFDNWSKYNGGSVLLATTTVPGEVFAGNRALKVICDGSYGTTSQWKIQLASDLVNTTVGQDYVISGWFKSTAAGAKLRFSTQPTASYEGDTQINTTWTLNTFTFNAKDAQTRIVMDMAGATNTVFYVDEVKMYLKP